MYGLIILDFSCVLLFVFPSYVHPTSIKTSAELLFPARLDMDPMACCHGWTSAKTCSKTVWKKKKKTKNWEIDKSQIGKNLWNQPSKTVWELGKLIHNKTENKQSHHEIDIWKNDGKQRNRVENAKAFCNRILGIQTEEMPKQSKTPLPNYVPKQLTPLARRT